MANLEREAINLAHIWPKTYSSLEDGKEKICCYWFIGLKLDMEGGKGGQLDLTTPIKVILNLNCPNTNKDETQTLIIFSDERFSGVHRHCDEVGHTDQCVENWDENLGGLQEEKRPENIFASL